MPNRALSSCCRGALLLLLAGAVPAPAQVSAQEDRDAIAAAEAFVQAFLEGRLEAAVALCDSALASRTSPQRLDGIRMSILNSMGRPEEAGAGRVTARDAGSITVTVPVRFADSSLNTVVRVSSRAAVSGYSFLPEGMEASWRPPAYADPDGLVEREAHIRPAGLPPVPGTLTVPAGPGPFPGVVLVGGAGPGQRDGGMGASLPMKDLAWGLASRGIAVLRYDKRSFVYPQEFQGKTYTMNDEVILDAVNALAWLRKVPEVDPDRVHLVAHSMGGMAAPRIARQAGRTAGIVFLAVPSRPLPDVIGDQVEHLAALPSGGMSPTQLQATRAALARVRSLTPRDRADATPVLGAPAAFWLDLGEHDPVEEAQSLDLPMLFLQGARDFQVGEVDLQGWRRRLSGRPDVQFRLFPRLNHLFIAGEGPGTFAEYRRPGHVSREVVETVAAWVDRSAGVRPVP